MDTNELLNQVVTGVVNEDNEAASAAFKTYATLKVRSMLESPMSKKDKKDECTPTEEDVAADVIDKANKDD